LPVLSANWLNNLAHSAVSFLYSRLVATGGLRHSHPTSGDDTDQASTVALAFPVPAILAFARPAFAQRVPPPSEERGGAEYYHGSIPYRPRSVKGGPRTSAISARWPRLSELPIRLFAYGRRC
jgi:hypothetical protein